MPWSEKLSEQAAVRDAFSPQDTLTLEDVRRALAGPRPGPEAHLRMATQPRPRPEEFGHTTPPREGAVLCLLYPIEGRLHFVLTRRTDTVRDHKGQISFPGGAREAEDESLAVTAVREAEEELGISLAQAEILGTLTSISILPSNYRIHPYVAYLPTRPSYRPCPSEVAELLEIPLRDLFDPSLRQSETWPVRGKEVLVPFFSLGGQKVWGATAMVLSEFAVILEGIREKGRTRQHGQPISFPPPSGGDQPSHAD